MKPSLQSILEHFHHPERYFIPLSSYFPITSTSPSPRQSPVCFLSRDLPFLDISCKWSHTTYSFCDWIVLRSIMFSGFIHVEASVSTSFLSMNSILYDDIFEVCFHFMGSLYFPPCNLSACALCLSYTFVMWLCACTLPTPKSLETVTLRSCFDSLLEKPPCSDFTLINGFLFSEECPNLLTPPAFLPHLSSNPGNCRNLSGWYHSASCMFLSSSTSFIICLICFDSRGSVLLFPGMLSGTCWAIS